MTVTTFCHRYHYQVVTCTIHFLQCESTSNELEISRSDKSLSSNEEESSSSISSIPAGKNLKLYVTSLSLCIGSIFFK